MSMKRKVIQLAGKTLVVSLPAKWAKKTNIKKGDEITLIEQQKSMLISKDNIQEPLHASTINITGFSTPLVWYYLTSLYRAGTHQITVQCNTSTLHNSQGQEQPVMKLLHDIAHRMIGMEVIKQSKNICVIKQLSSIKENELDHSMKRTFQAILDMSQEIQTAIIKDDKVLLEELGKYADNQINRLTDFCLRAISKTHDHSKITLAHTYVITSLEDIGDFFSYIAQLCIKHTISKNYKRVFKEMSTFLNQLYMTTYAFTNQRYINLYTQQQHVRNNIRDVQHTGNITDVMVGDLLYTITKRAMEMLSYSLILAHPNDAYHLSNT
jgi:phosphate uptake regulator